MRLRAARPLLAALAGAALLLLADGATFQGRLYALPSGVPQPLAFFPLTDGAGSAVATWPDTAYAGTLISTKREAAWWAGDDTFGTVLTCNKDTRDYAALSPVNYAATGNFTVAFWAKPNASAMGGTFFDYLYSHSDYGVGNDQTAFAPNSLNVYLPQSGHPAFGLVRTVVKDASDNDTTSFLDSDGTYNNNQPRPALTAARVTDGRWHHVAVSNRGDGQRGFLVYVDGVLVAQLPPPGYTPGDGSLQLDGGGPMQLGGEVVLCSRDNVTSDRHFTGSLAHLALFNATLSAPQIAALRAAVPVAAAGPQASLAGLGSSVWLDQYRNSSFLQTANGSVAMCLANQSSAACQPGFACAPLPARALQSLGSNYSGLPVGVCARPNGVPLLPGSTASAAAYFPLSNYTTEAWPLPAAWFWNTSAAAPATWARDATFGSVIDCSAAAQATLSVGPFAWGTSGAFAVNLWAQPRAGGRGDLFQYLLSARSKAGGSIVNVTTDMYTANQVHIYLPEPGHPAHDLVRVIVKDGSDNYTGPASANFLDSDGIVGSNLARSTPRLNLTDGRWHMITVSTPQSGGKGYAIYVDGLLMAVEQSPQPFFAVSGGAPIQVDGDLVLCGRADQAADRFFDGRVAQLTVFDTALTPLAVSALYSQVYQSPPDSSVKAAQPRNAPVSASPPPPAPQQTAGASSVLFPGGGLPAGGIFNRDGQLSGSADASTGATPPPASTGMSGGAIAGIVIASVVGTLAVGALVAMVALSARRRRMGGVARLQEVPMPELRSPAPEDGYLEHQFVGKTSAKMLQGGGKSDAA